MRTKEMRCVRKVGSGDYRDGADASGAIRASIRTRTTLFTKLTKSGVILAVVEICSFQTDLREMIW